MISSLGAHEVEALAAGGRVDIVDVREAREWAGGHLPGSRHVPLDELRADPERALPRDRVVFVCAKGARSQVAAKIAERRGLQEIYSLEGGLRAWKDAGLELVTLDTPAAALRPTAIAQPSRDEEDDDVQPALDALIAANLRGLRASRGLTLDALAKTAGVSRGLLGQAELGQAVPSLEVLWKIAVALKVPFATLVAASPPAGTVVLRRSKAKEIVSAEGRFRSRALFPPTERGSVEFYDLRLAANSREEAEAHQPGTRENLVVYEGRLELEVGGKRFRLATGDAIFFAADVRHTYINTGAEECRMHLVMTYVT